MNEIPNNSLWFCEDCGKSIDLRPGRIFACGHNNPNCHTLADILAWMQISPNALYMRQFGLDA